MHAIGHFTTDVCHEVGPRCWHPRTGWCIPVPQSASGVDVFLNLRIHIMQSIAGPEI
jgi:hypothetical protein